MGLCFCTNTKCLWTGQTASNVHHGLEWHICTRWARQISRGVVCPKHVVCPYSNGGAGQKYDGNWDARWRLRCQSGLGREVDQARLRAIVGMVTICCLPCPRSEVLSKNRCVFSLRGAAGSGMFPLFFGFFWRGGGGLLVVA